VNNNSEIVSFEEQEVSKVISNYLQNTNKKSLNKQELEGLLVETDTNSPEKPKNNMPLLIGGGVVVLVLGVVIGLLVSKRNKKQK
jgi:hypothetical protein